MKCPYCGEELGPNNACLDPTCSHFDTIIDFSEIKQLINTRNNFNSVNNDVANIVASSSSFDTSYNDSTGHYNTDTVSRKEFAAYIGSNNVNFYLKYLPIREQNNNFISWNWPCFFLIPFWLLYRKLYSIFGIYLGVNTGITLLIRFVESNVSSSSLNSLTIIRWLINIVVHVVFALFANAIYLNIAEKKIKSIKTTESYLGTSQYINKLYEKGGITLVAPFIYLGVSILLVLLLVFIAFSVLPSLYR